MSKYYIIIIAIVVCITDQILKYLVLSNLYFAENLTIVRNLLSVTKIYNTGAAFSLFENSTAFLAIFSIIVSITIVFYIFRKNTSLEVPYIIAWGLILGGTIGNLADRLIYGYVIDFIKLDFIKFPIFNVADASINVGAFLIVIYSFVKLRKPVQNEQ